MAEQTYAANSDLVVEMQEAGVGVEEILQYSQGVFSEQEIHTLIRGLKGIVERSDDCELPPLGHCLQRVGEDAGERLF